MTYLCSEYDDVDCINNRCYEVACNKYPVQIFSQQQIILELSRNVLLGEVPTVAAAMSYVFAARVLWSAFYHTLPVECLCFRG